MLKRFACQCPKCGREEAAADSEEGIYMVRCACCGFSGRLKNVTLKTNRPIMPMIQPSIFDTHAIKGYGLVQPLASWRN